MLKAPCKDCQDRILGCHSTCQKYIEFRKGQDELSEVKQREKKLFSDLMSSLRRENRLK